MPDIKDLFDKNGKPLQGAALDARTAKLAREKEDKELDEKIDEKVEQAIEQSPNAGGGKKDYGGGTRLAQLYRKATGEGAGTFGGIVTASKERLTEKMDVRNSFGNGLMGAVGEKVFGKGYDALKQGQTENAPTPTPVSGGIDAEQAQAMCDDIGILTKNSMFIPKLAWEFNVIRQNIVKITNSMLKKKTDKNGKKGKNPAAISADMYFVKADEQEAKMEEERKKLRSGRESKSPTPAAGPEKKDEGFSLNGIIQSAIGWLKDGLFKGLKMLFKPSNLMKTLGKVFVIGTLIAALVNGIMDGWNTWQETGDLGEAIISGLAGIVDFLTFGIFNKDDIKDVFRKIGDFLDPVIDTISGVVTTIKDWVVNNVGIPEITLLDNKITGKVTVGPFYPFKSNPKSAAPEVSQKPKTKDVAAQPAADKAEAAAVKKEKQQSEPAKVGEVAAPGAASAASEAVSPPKQVEQQKDDQGKVFEEKAAFFAKKRDESLSKVEKLKKTRDQEAKDGASPEVLQQYNNDINAAITDAGNYEQQRIQLLVKAGQNPKPEITVPEELKKSTEQLQGAVKDSETAGTPTQMPTMGDINVNAGESPQPTATRRTSFDRVRLGSPDAGGETKEQKPSLVNTLSDSDAKSIFSESASPSADSGSGGGGDSASSAITPTGDTSSSTPSLSSAGGDSGGSAPSLTENAPAAPSGAAISESSAQVAEEQRTEMSSQEPTIINNASTNTSSGSVGGDNKSVASVVDDVFAAMVAA